MADVDGSLIRHAVVAACLVVLVTLPAAAQQIQQPVVAPAPDAPEFLPRFDFHLSVNRLVHGQAEPPAVLDTRFSWDSHFGGSFDLVDYVGGRATVLVDYHAVMGSELRPFDPNQGNYTLEGSLSRRFNDSTELAAIFHHVSRHLSDRPKAFAVAWNELGARLLHHHGFGPTTLDVAVEGGRAVQHSYVDYTWMAELNALIRRPVNEHLGIFGHGSGQLYEVSGAVPRRGSQHGYLLEAGIRLNGRGGATEVFGGYEKRIDADPLDRQSQRWVIIGFRLLSK